MTTKDWPIHFSKSPRVFRSSSGKFGGIPISFTLSPVFTPTFYRGSAWLMKTGDFTHDSANDRKGDFYLPRCVTSTGLLELLDHAFQIRIASAKAPC